MQNVVVFLIRKNNQILIEHRTKASQHSQNKYRFPAGHVEAGETLEQALRRETHEELGVQIKSFEKIGSTPFIGDDKVHRELHYFLIETLDPPQTNEAHLWISVQDADQMDFEMDRQLIREILKDDHFPNRI